LEDLKIDSKDEKLILTCIVLCDKLILANFRIDFYIPIIYIVPIIFTQTCLNKNHFTLI